MHGVRVWQTREDLEGVQMPQMPCFTGLHGGALFCLHLNEKTWRATSLVCTACMNAINKVCHESMNPSSATLANRMCFGNCHTNITRVSTRIFGKAFRNTPFAGNGLFRSFLRGTSGLLIKIHGQDYQPISQ